MTLRRDILTSCSVRTNRPQTAEVGSAPAAACGQVGRIDNAMRPQMRGRIRKYVIFFENIDYNHGPWFASSDPARDGGVRPFRDLGQRPADQARRRRLRRADGAD